MRTTRRRPRRVGIAVLERIASQLETAAAHCRVGATHFRNREIPRAAAHSFAAYGYLVDAAARLDGLARQFAARSTLA